MKQTKRASLIEAMLNVAIGFGVSVASQMFILAAYGHPITLWESLSMGFFFTIISIGRSFLVRRWFEHLRIKGILA